MSNLIKPMYYVALDDCKQLEAPIVRNATMMLQLYEQSEPYTAEQRQELDEVDQLKKQILQDAEAFAEGQIRQAAEEAAKLKEKAEQEIEAWWSDRRDLDEAERQANYEQARQDGYQHGEQEAVAAVQQTYSDYIEEASEILQKAHAQKQHIILEAEPFLVDLSCAIAKKIIGEQLTLEPDRVTQMIRQVLTRKRETGLITLCVSPMQYALVQEAKGELELAIDSQAELQILPDATVQDAGCVVRTAIGSMDARIDTQLQEIKSALKQLAVRDEGVTAHEQST